jgi:hypothetical protein
VCIPWPPKGGPDIQAAEELPADRKRCAVCGQVFDTRDEEQVFHHDARPHPPLKPRTQTD